MEKEKQSLLEKLMKSSKLTKGILIGVAVLVVAGIILAIIFSPSGETTFDIETSLKEVLESSDLSTAEYTYNSIAKVKIDENGDDSEENIKYHISYKGTVKSGFDFSKLDSIKEDNKITIVIPEIEIQSVEIETEMDYIFTNKKYDTENTYAEAYTICSDDLELKAKNNKTLRNTAVESAIETITALTKPFESQFEDGMVIEVVYVDDINKEGK